MRICVFKIIFILLYFANTICHVRIKFTSANARLKFNYFLSKAIDFMRFKLIIMKKMMSNSIKTKYIKLMLSIF